MTSQHTPPGGPPETIVAVDGVSKRFGERQAVDGLDLHCAEGHLFRAAGA